MSYVFLAGWLTQTAYTFWILRKWRHALDSWGRALDRNEELCALMSQQQHLMERLMALSEPPRH